MTPSPIEIMADVKIALKEDIGSGDLTATLLPAHLKATAMIISREPMFVCGLPWVNAVFSEINPHIQIAWEVEEGTWLNEPSVLCYITGSARSILTAERTALNFFQTLSGTATKTYQFVQELKDYKTRLLDTRKTIPGLRKAQKYAVACAGGVNHRLGLYDAILIKENHIKACGSIKNAMVAAKKIATSHNDIFIEVEVESIEELREALSEKPNRIMLDNFNYSMIREAVEMSQSSECQLEVSGGVDLTTLKAIAQLGVDFISVGSITKSITAIDLSLLIKEIV